MRPVVTSLVVVFLIISTASADDYNVDDSSEFNVKKDDHLMKNEGKETHGIFIVDKSLLHVPNTEELPEPQACIGGMGSFGMYKLFLLAAIFLGGVILLLVILFLKCYHQIAEESRQRQISKQEKAGKL